MIDDAEESVRAAQTSDLEWINQVRAQLKLAGVGAEDLFAGGRVTFVATKSAAVVGYLTLKFPASANQPLDADVEQLFVLSILPRKGRGSRLLQRAEHFAATQTTATSLSLRVGSGKEFKDARECYANFGLVVTGKEGPGVHMAKPLQRAEK